MDSLKAVIQTASHQVGRKNGVTFLFLNESQSQTHNQSERRPFRKLFRLLYFENTSDMFCRCIFHFLTFPFHFHLWSIGPRQGYDPPPGRRRDATPGGPSPLSYLKRALPPRLREGPSVMEGGEMGKEPRGWTPPPSPTT